MRRGSRAQRGSVLVVGAALLGVALSCLAVLDVAHVYTVRRELQKVADLSALAGARLPGDCGGMQDRAAASAVANGHVRGDDRGASFECGAWAADTGFRTAAPDPTAVRAVVTRRLPYFLLPGSAREVQAEATARNQAYDVFSLGTSLTTLHAGALNTLLTAIAGTKVDLDLAAYTGLAQSRLRLLDLLDADTLGVGSVKELLATHMRFADLTLAMARGIARDSPASATLLESLALRMPPGLQLRLQDLIDVKLADLEAAGRAEINALELLLASAQLATGDHLLDLSAGLPPNPLASTNLQMRIIEPPRLAIGTEGVQAKSAQVRLLLDTRIGNLGAIPGLGAISVLRVPLYIEAASGTATLRRMECASDPADCAVEIDVQSGVARACIGNDAMAAGAGTACTAPAALASAQVAGLAEIAVQGRAVADLSAPGAAGVRFGREGFAGSSVTDSSWQDGTSPGASVAHLLKSLFLDIDLHTEIRLLGGLDLGGIVNGLAELLLRRVGGAVAGAATTVLEPILNSLLDPLLAVLGIQVGVADLHQIGLHCGQVELVR